MKTQITLALALAFGTTALADTPKAPDAKKAPDMKDAKKEEPKKEAPKKEAPKAAMPKPPQEIADMAKAMAGTWKCAGKFVMDPSDPTKMADMKGSMTAKLDLDGWWINGSYTGKSGPVTMKGQMFTTYDATTKKWIRTMVDNMGASESATSAGLKDSKIVWEGDMRSSMPGMTAVKTKATEEIVAGGKEVKMVFEGSIDGGKKWMAMGEMGCKK